jgi:hypothetical protein
MRNLIEKNLSGKKVLILFVLTSIIYTLMLTVSIPKVMTYSNGMKTLDMIPSGYDIIYVNSLLGTLEAKGRAVYLFNQIPIDMVYPFLFGITYCLIFAYFLKKINRLESKLFYLTFLPLFAGFFDYMENIGIIILLNNYPDYSELMVKITNAFSILKSSFTTVFFIGLIILLAAFGISKLFFKKRQK